MTIGSILAGGAILGAAYVGIKNKNKNVNISSCFFDKLAIPIYEFTNKIHLNNTLSVDDIKSDHININTPHKTLYALELSGDNTVATNLSNSMIEQLFESASKDIKGYFFQAILKDGFYQKQYLFSYSQELLMSIAKHFELKLLTGEQIVDVIFDLFLQNSYYLDNMQLHRQLNISEDIEISMEPTDHTFNKIIKNNVFCNLNEVDVYQSYKARKNNMKGIDYNELYNLDFNGVIWGYFDFYKGRVGGFIEKILAKTKFYGGKEPFEQLKKQFDTNSTELILTNYIIQAKNLDKSVLNKISESLGINFVKKELNSSNIIKKTPLKDRDVEFDLPVTIDFLYNKITPIHKKASENPDFYGKDNKNAHINFSFSGDNANPHSVLIAPTGSGKSVGKQKMISQMLELDFETGYAKKLGNKAGNYRIRNFDVGYSDKPTFDLIHSNSQNNSGEIQSDLDKFSFNIVNFELNDKGLAKKEDIQFTIDLISMILESQSTEPLNIGEAGKFKEIVDYLYSKKEFQNYKVRNIIDNTDLYNELIALGYKDTTSLKSIEEEKYDYLKKPLLQDILKVARLRKESELITPDEKKSYLGLESKLNDVNTLEYFSHFDNLNISNTDYIYTDLNNIKENSLFVPIFFAIFWKIYIKDRQRALECKHKGVAAPKLMYLIEEASNHFRFKTFEVMFEKLIFEARKYNVHMMFVLQNIEDIPYTIFKNINTRMFLFPPKQKEGIIHYIKENIKASDEIIRAMNEAKQFQFAIWYDKGIIHTSFEMSPVELNLFTTNPNATKED